MWKEMREGTIDASAFADFLVSCPEDIKKLYLEMSERKYTNLEDKQKSAFFIIKSMKEHLYRIDQRIEKTLE